jgi:hypothetical protein
MSRLFYNAIIDGNSVSSGETNFIADMPELMHTIYRAKHAHRMLVVNNDRMNTSTSKGTIHPTAVMVSPGFRAQQYLTIYCHLVHAKRVLTAYGYDEPDSRLVKSLDWALDFYRKKVTD